ncbi:MAG: hypothetical protein ACLUDU_07315 [Butyricimonas faecihominis]
MAEDAERVFEFLQNNYKQPIQTATGLPCMRERFESLIDNEIKNAKDGKRHFT